MMCHLTLMRMSGSYRRITLHIWWMNLLTIRHMHLLEHATASPLSLRIIAPDTPDLFGNKQASIFSLKEFWWGLHHITSDPHWLETQSNLMSPLEWTNGCPRGAVVSPLTNSLCWHHIYHAPTKINSFTLKYCCLGRCLKLILKDFFSKTTGPICQRIKLSELRAWDPKDCYTSFALLHMKIKWWYLRDLEYTPGIEVRLIRVCQRELPI
jgi:hypothetical protein